MTSGYVTCPACKGSGIDSSGDLDKGCTTCGGSGIEARQGLDGWPNSLRKGSGKIKVPDVEAHERMLSEQRRARREREERDKRWDR